MNTLYRPVHKSGAASLPHSSMTSAALWIQQQGTPADWRIEPIADPIQTPPTRDATPAERADLARYLYDLMDGQDEAEAKEEAQAARIAVFDRYQTDSPGYCGRVMVAVYSGGPNVHECYIWNSEGNLERVPSQHETDAEPDFNTPNPSEENAHLMQSVIELQRENIIYRLALETISENTPEPIARGIAQEVTRHHPPRPYPLADFGRAVLQILQDEKDWGSETMDQISAEAFRRGLAVEQNGFFKAQAVGAKR
jgi:hypothetical protein